MDDQTPQGGATLTGCPRGREQDRPLRQFEVCVRADDHRIIAAELEQDPAEALRDPRTDRPAHRRRSGRGNQSDARVIDQHFTNLAAPLDELNQSVGRLSEAE